MSVCPDHGDGIPTGGEPEVATKANAAARQQRLCFVRGCESVPQVYLMIVGGFPELAFGVSGGTYAKEGEANRGRADHLAA